MLKRRERRAPRVFVRAGRSDQMRLNHDRAGTRSDFLVLTIRLNAQANDLDGLRGHIVQERETHDLGTAFESGLVRRLRLV